MCQLESESTPSTPARRSSPPRPARVRTASWCVVCTLAATLLLVAGAAQAEFAGRPLVDNAFSPTGHTLRHGEVTIGLGPIGFGVADRVQFRTNLLLWAAQIYNGDIKVSLVDHDGTAAAIGIAASRLDLDFVGADDVGTRSYAPYAVVSRRIAGETEFHVGARYAFWEFDADGLDAGDADASALVSGTSYFGGIQHGFSERTKLVGDIGYDATFDGLRVGGGALFGWESFRLKLGLHYFDADEGFVVPMIGLWWRFDG